LGVPVLNWGVDYSLTWVRAPAYGGEFSNKKNLYHEGAGDASGTSWVPTQLSAVNVQLMRYADALLLLAEAEVELGNLETARTLVNMIRTRAGNCAQGPKQGDRTKIGVPIDDPGITWATYSVGTYNTAWTDAAAARNAVRWERRLELAIEGHRFFDLRRWGIAKQVMNDYIAVEKTRRSHYLKSPGYMDKHDLYPLPQVQLDLSQKEKVPQLKQLPGWQ
jgi:hypothetical protein